MSSLVNFPLDIQLKEFTACVIICLCNKWLPQQLASVTIRTVFGEEDIQRTILLSSYVRILSLSFPFLSAKLKEKQSEKISDKQKPEVNSW